MDSFEVAKVAGAVLSALLVIVGFRVALEIAETGHKQVTGYTLPLPAEPQPQEGAAVPAPVALPAEAFDPAAVASAAAEANPQSGAAAFKKCQNCHTSDKGGANKMGPNLWGIVGRAKASHAGFNYSEALKAKGGDWTAEDLAAFVHNPKGLVPGTKMGFPGIADPTEVADLLAYLETLK
jgi:cytochrome c